MVCDKLHIICGNCGQDLTKKDMAFWDYENAIEKAGVIIQTDDVCIACENCGTVHTLRKYMKK